MGYPPSGITTHDNRLQAPAGLSMRSYQKSPRTKSLRKPDDVAESRRVKLFSAFLVVFAISKTFSFRLPPAQDSIPEAKISRNLGEKKRKNETKCGWVWRETLAQGKLGSHFLSTLLRPRGSRHTSKKSQSDHTGAAQTNERCRPPTYEYANFRTRAPPT